MDNLIILIACVGFLLVFCGLGYLITEKMETGRIAKAIHVHFDRRYTINYIDTYTGRNGVIVIYELTRVRAKKVFYQNFGSKHKII